MTSQNNDLKLNEEQNKPQFLTDYSQKDGKWDNHKTAVDEVSFFYHTSADPRHQKYANRVFQCAEILRFMYVDDLTTGESKLKLKNAHFCRVRLCPICQWRRSAAWRARLFQNLPKIFEEYKNLSFIFLTLTVKNININNLSEELSKMNSAWNKLRLNKKFKSSILGYIRATEVTKNKDDAHPHFHCILAVKNSYFKKNYIKQAEWAEMWKSCLKVDYLPVIDVRKIKSTDNQIESKAIIETLKYTTKISDLLEDQTWFLTLTEQLRNKRFLATGGIFKDILKEEVSNEEMLLKDENQDEEQEENYNDELWFGFDHIQRKYKKVNKPER